MRWLVAGPADDTIRGARTVAARLGYELVPAPAEVAPAVGSVVFVDCRGPGAALSPFAERCYAVALVQDRDPIRVQTLVTAGARDVLFLPAIPAEWAVRLAVVAAGARRFSERLRESGADRATIQTLYEDSQRFELVSRATNDVVYDWDLREGHIVWNDALAVSFGHAPDSAVDSLAWWEAQLHPDDRDRVIDTLDQVVESGQHVWTSEYRFRRADGTFADVLDRGMLMFGADTQPLRVVGVMMDITAQKRVQGQLVLADRMASVGTLAAGVAHEINNPLTWMGASLDAALEGLARLPGGAQVDAVREAITDARAGAARIQNIVSDLRLFSRAESDVVQPTDVVGVIEAALSLAAPEIRERARVETSLPAVPRVNANGARLGQVVLNLVLNAVQAIPVGGPADNVVAVAAWSDGDGWVRFSVRDTGVGIAPELQSRIFDPFFTTKPVGEGTGLGLSITRGLVDGMGGRIEVESEIGLGTTFTVTLPAAPAAVAPTPLPPPPRLDDTPRGRVLVVDDEELIVGFLRGILGSSHEVDGYEQPLRALAALLQGEEYDVILCDLMMPGLTGPELYHRAVAARPELAQRFVVVTGGAYTPAARAFLDNVPVPVLEKPFRVQAVRALVADRVAALRAGV